MPGIAIVQQKGAAFALATLATPVTGFALMGRPVSDNISALAVRTVQDLENHSGTRFGLGVAQMVTHSERIAYQHL